MFQPTKKFIIIAWDTLYAIKIKINAFILEAKVYLRQFRPVLFGVTLWHSPET
jgi:hypothetical protein